MDLTVSKTAHAGTSSQRQPYDIPEEFILKIWQKLVLIQIKFLFSEKYATDLTLCLELSYIPEIVFTPGQYHG